MEYRNLHTEKLKNDAGPNIENLHSKEIKKGYRHKHKKTRLIVHKIYCSPAIITVLLFFLSIRIYVLFTYGIYKLALGKKWETKQKHTLKISSDCKPNVLVTCENHLDTVF